MGNIDDAADRRFKVFREHSSDVALGDKAVSQGYCITAQNSTTGDFTLANAGDECGWLFWAENTRAIGAWGQAVAAIATDASGTIRPVAGQDLAADSTFATKTVVTTDQGGDATKVRSVTGSLPGSGDFGLVVQCLNQDSFELLWYPVG